MKYVPWPYQRYCIDRMIRDEKLGLFLEMGLGKTVIALTAVMVLRYHMLAVNKVLVIAPKKVAESTWTREAAKWDHLGLLRFSAVLGSAKQRERALATPADVYVTNRDNVAWLVNYYRNDWPFDMVICDEFSSFKNAKSKRFKALKNMLPHIRRVVGLTGTPAPNGLEDLWAQVFLLDQGQRLGKTVSGFRDRYFTFNPYTHTREGKPGAEQVIQKAIQDICVSMKAEDYLVLPRCIIADVPIPLDAAARKAYETLESKMLLEVDEQTITAKGAMALSNKLLQLCNGALYAEGHQAVHVHDCKVEVLQEVVEGLNGQHALVFYSFQSDVVRIRAALSKSTDIETKTPGKLRLMEINESGAQDAWNRGDVDILLAHPASAAYGLNLQDGGHHVIWFGLNWSLELYQQANARLHRQGQKHPVIVHRLIVDEGMDREVAAALEGKVDTQEALMLALRARIEKARGENHAKVNT